MTDPDQGTRPPPRTARRARRLGMGLSVVGHLAILAALLWAPVKPLGPPPPEPPPLTVTLVAPSPSPPSPGEAPAGGAAAAPAAAPAPPTPPRPAKILPRRAVRPTPAPPDVEPLPVSPAPAAVAELSDAQLAGAITAGSGAGGGGSGSGAGAGSGSGSGTGAGCDMVRRLQTALRQDADIQAAVAQAQRADGASRRAMMIWNGDWVLSRGQEGKGLAGVRQAIVMEVAFAPEACRADPVRGLVLISLNDGPGSARLVLGSGTWRWSDLLSARGAARVTRW